MRGGEGRDIEGNMMEQDRRAGKGWSKLRGEREGRGN